VSSAGIDPPTEELGKTTDVLSIFIGDTDRRSGITPISLVTIVGNASIGVEKASNMGRVFC
jgi:hypothetical protein